MTVVLVTWKETAIIAGVVLTVIVAGGIGVYMKARWW